LRKGESVGPRSRRWIEREKGKRRGEVREEEGEKRYKLGKHVGEKK